MFHFVKKIDIFGGQVPSFNIHGQKTIQTIPGAIATIVIAILTLSFGILKFEHLVRRKNPVINETTSVLAEGSIQQLSDKNIAMAFAVEDFYSGTPLEDSRFYRWYSVHWTVDKGVWSSQNSLLQKCTQDDLKKFYDYENDATRQKVEAFKAQDQFYCLDE